MFYKMLRVSRQKPCLVCGKPDWCLVAPDGSAAICARIQDNSVKRCGEAGWLHVFSRNGTTKAKGFNARIRTSIENIVPDRAVVNFDNTARNFHQQMSPGMFIELAQQLGVSEQSLRSLCVGWNGYAYTFPMADAAGRVTGIRVRFKTGQKISMKGSITGMFVPIDLPQTGPLLICEGPTDTAAALTLGFAAVGRPNCSSRIDLAIEYAKGRDVIVVADNDEVGLRGAQTLISSIVLYCPSVKLLIPPPNVKDLRGWVQGGFSRQELVNRINSTESSRIVF